MEVAEEGEVLLLEAQSLLARVSATLQRGLNTATDDLAAAQNKSKKNGGENIGGDAGASSEAGSGKDDEREAAAAGENADDECVDSVYGLSPDGSSVGGGG